MRLFLVNNNGSFAKPLGSGFVTNRKGLFISVGHLLKNHQDHLNQLCAVFPDAGDNCKLYKIRIYHQEYVDPRKDDGTGVPGHHLDVIIGRVLLYDLEKHNKIETKRPLETEELKLHAFENKGDHRYRIQNGKVDFSQLTKTTLDLTIKHRQYGIISEEHSDYINDPSLAPQSVRFYNCLLLNNNEEEDHKGTSGGPILVSLRSGTSSIG